MLPPNTRVTLFPNKKMEKFRDSIIHQIETLERKTFPKNEIMAIKEEIFKKTNNLLIAYYEVEVEQTEEIREFDKRNQRNQRRESYNKKVQVKIMGYLIYSHISSTALPLTKILKLCVHPSYRRSGLATMLLKWVFEKTGVPKKSSANLHVDITREGAVSLYRKVGFKVVEQVIDYYEVGRDALLMEYEELSNF
ncbi:18722_t:CDS:1 [Acaulospora morrowiae]|uniref:18722_t:CDS:1 n=1 Tax=Acaulospora morrowiae TaxID=94023 RepID=A0A9N8VJC4_9GLOM|nr:18722_t:CDS:1 [Acaulospora morrowiae]